MLCMPRQRPRVGLASARATRASSICPLTAAISDPPGSSKPSTPCNGANGIWRGSMKRILLPGASASIASASAASGAGQVSKNCLAGPAIAKTRGADKGVSVGLSSLTRPNSSYQPIVLLLSSLKQLSSRITVRCSSPELTSFSTMSGSAMNARCRGITATASSLRSLSGRAG